MQVEELMELAQSANAEVHHVKPHGALYNMAARDCEMARAIAWAVSDFDEGLILHGLSGSFGGVCRPELPRGWKLDTA